MAWLALAWQNSGVKQQAQQNEEIEIIISENQRNIISSASAKNGVKAAKYQYRRKIWRNKENGVWHQRQ